jgi:hypothetical protein
MFQVTHRPSSGADMFRATSAHHQEFFSLLHMQPPVICASARPVLLNYTEMHRTKNIKFVNAKQAKEIYNCKNIKRKLYKINAAIWYNNSATDGRKHR